MIRLQLTGTPLGLTLNEPPGQREARRTAQLIAALEAELQAIAPWVDPDARRRWAERLATAAQLELGL